MAIEKIKLGDFKELLFEIANKKYPIYEPTGLQEDIIAAVGCGKYEIILALHANDVGKTTAGINILKNVIWPCDEKWFAFWQGYSVFRDHKFDLKQFRITGTAEALSDSGAIQTEIKNWWPEGQYEWTKAHKGHFSQCECKNGWRGDALTYTQDRTEYESRKIDIMLSDEPPRHQLIGAMTSRFTEGCLWIIAATPVQCGIFLDVVDDLEEKNTRVKRLTGTAYENSKTKGKPNHLGTKCGLRSDSEIDSKVARCPVDERDARIYGKATNKSGKIYPMADKDLHVINFPLEALKQCNCYTSLDIHRGYYPAIEWFAVTPGSTCVTYNEYPKFEDFGAFYDEARGNKRWDKTVEELARIIYANDLTVYGAKIRYRTYDPHLGSVIDNPGEFIRQLSTELIKIGACGVFVPADFEKIEVQRETIRNMLYVNPELPKIGINLPSMFVRKECQNSWRALSRHFWEEGKDKESEDFKDFCDTKRYFASTMQGKIVYKPDLISYEHFENTVEARSKDLFNKNTTGY